LFLTPPILGVVFPYYELALWLGRDQPVYGLQSVGVAGEADPLSSIEAMAAHYLDIVREVQPDGPYLLGGWSFGAHVAYEMAQ
jgi:thioesterase domain-containing protein